MTSNICKYIRRCEAKHKLCEIPLIYNLCRMYAQKERENSLGALGYDNHT